MSVDLSSSVVTASPEPSPSPAPSSHTSSGTNPILSNASGSIELDAFKLRVPLDSHSFGKDKPTALAVFDDFVYIGTDNGELIVYVIERRAPGQREEDRGWMQMSRHKVGKKSISQLQLMNPMEEFHYPGPNTATLNRSKAAEQMPPLLFVLCDSRLTAHHPHTLQVLIDFTSIHSNPLFFAIDKRFPHYICVANKGKKKVYMYSYTVPANGPGAGSHQEIKQISLPETPVAMVWCGEALAVGFKKAYSLVSTMHNTETKELPVPIEGSNPCFCITRAGELLLTSNTDIGIFVNFRGEPMPKNPIHWTKSTLFMTECDSFLCAVLSDDSIKVASQLDTRIVQSIPLRGRGVSICSNSSRVLVATNQQEVILLQMTSIEEQIQQYLDLGKTEEALALLFRTRPTAQKLASFHSQAGFVLARELQFTAAFQHFSQSDCDPRELISLFPEFACKSLSYTMVQNPNSPFAPTITMADIVERGRKTASFQPDNKRFKQILATSSRSLLRLAKFHLALYLWDKRQRIVAQIKRSSVVSTSTAIANGDESISPTIVSTSSPTELQLAAWVDTALLMVAVELESATSRPGEESAPADDRSRAPTVGGRNRMVNEFVDPSDRQFPYTLQQLLFPSNQCHLPDCEQFLVSKQNFNALALLYQSKGLTRKALELWHKLGLGELKQSVFDPLSAELPGIRDTVILLSSMNDCPLLWEFAEWPLLKRPIEGLKIFTSSSRDQQLPHEKVLQFLKRLNQKLIENSKLAAKATLKADSSIDLVENYLEHIVLYEQVKESSYHTQLALAYLRKASQLVLPSRVADSASASSAAITPARVPIGSEPGLLGPTRVKLFRFLQQSSLYDADALLQQLIHYSWGSHFTKAAAQSADPLALPAPMELFHSDPSIFFEELILLYSKLKMHQRVLQLFVFGLKDQNGAALYCQAVAKQAQRQQEADKKDREASAGGSRSKLEKSESFNSISSSPPETSMVPQSSLSAANPLPVPIASHPGDVFLDLVDLYFSPDYQRLFGPLNDPNAKQRDLNIPPPSAYQMAINVLVQYAAFIDPVKALRIIPPWVPMKPLSVYFARILPETIHARRHNQVVRGLLKSESLRISTIYHKLRSMSFTIQQDRRCLHCNKPLGDSVFVAHPITPAHPDYFTTPDFDNNKSQLASLGLDFTTIEAMTRQSVAMADSSPVLLPGLSFVLVHYQCSAGYSAEASKRKDRKINQTLTSRGRGNSNKGNKTGRT